MSEFPITPQQDYISVQSRANPGKGYVWGDGALSHLILDPMVTRFNTLSGGVLTPTQQTALSSLVQGLRSNGTLGKYRVIYPFIGGVAQSHRLNLVDPTLYPLVFTGAGHTHNSDGYSHDSASTCEAAIPISTLFSLDNVGVSIYSGTAAAIETADVGWTVGGLLSTHLRWSDGNHYIDIGSYADRLVVPVPSGAGLFQFGRDRRTTYSNTGQGVITTGKADNIGGLPSNFQIGFGRVYGFIALSTALSQAELTADRVVIQAYQQALGRAV